MSRAIVLIGVSQTASSAFPTLEGVEGAIVKMESWAKSQGIPQIVKITDVGEGAVERVTITLINDEIEALLAKAISLQQLIIYFSGHGVVNSLSEYQLLSLAPHNANEAINVSASIAVAQTWKVPHVVFFSDACRTAAPTIQVSRIMGGLIIPNEIVPGPEKLVDVFYATRLGTPALEVAADGKQYVAVYTDMLSKGLRGDVPALIRNGYIRPRPLKNWLAEAVPEHLIEMNLSVLVSQSPEARISSGDEEWLAEFEQPVHAAPPDNTNLHSTTTPSMSDGVLYNRDDSADSVEEQTENVSPGPSAPLPPSETAAAEVREALDTIYSKAPPTRRETLVQRARRALSRHFQDLLHPLRRRMRGIPVDVKEDYRSGFHILGVGVRDAWCANGVTRVDRSADDCTLTVDTELGGVEVLIEFDTGRGVLLPFLRGYVGVLQVEAGELVEVHYERFDSLLGYAIRPEIQSLRSAVYKASTLGTLDLDPETASMLADQLQEDPALAVYMAYAYQGMGKLGRIRDMREYFLGYRRMRLFDMDLLARTASESNDTQLPLLPSTPLLSQGWALVDALWPAFPAVLKPLRQHVGQSLWSHYDPGGVAILKAWIDDRRAGRAIHTTEGDAA